MKRFTVTNRETHGHLPLTADESVKDMPKQRFAYLADDGAERLPAESSDMTIKLLDQLGEAMVEAADEGPGEGNSSLPPIYTFWGQFIDHDITLNTDRDQFGTGNAARFNIRENDFRPLAPSFVAENLENLRSMRLDLDSVYGDGPDGSVEDAELYCDDADINEVCPDIFGSLKIGLAEDSTLGVVPPPRMEDKFRDLPRKSLESGESGKLGKATIGDDRNDENLLIAQFHTAFLRFHNRALEELGDFESARTQTRLHYQWLVVHDFLKAIADPTVVDAVLKGDTRFSFSGDYMPVEFSAAAFRFGHSMVRSGYDYNENFGRGANSLTDGATFNQLFQFTGNNSERNPATPLAFHGRLPDNWIADWNRLALRSEPFNDGLPERFGRKIDSKLSTPLTDLLNEGEDLADQVELRELMKHLGRRNLRRGYLLSVPSGQAMAQIAGVEVMREHELLNGVGKSGRTRLEAVLQSENGMLLHTTPLWFYILREAEYQADGHHLGALGSRIVAETLIGLLQYDQNSALALHWGPKNSELIGGADITTIDSFLRYAGVL